MKTLPFVVAFIHSLFLPLCEAAEFPRCDSYLMLGKLHSNPQNDSQRVLHDSHFMVAVTPERVLVGWSHRSGTDTQDSAEIIPGRPCEQIFHYLDRKLTHGLGIECKSTYGPNLLDCPERHFHAVVLQKAVPQSPMPNLIGESITGPFNDCPFLFFGCDPSVDFDRQHFSSLLSAGHGEFSNQYCRITLAQTAVDSKPLLKLLQSADSIGSVRTQIPLAKVTTTTFPTGLDSTTITCTFHSAIDNLSKAPWSAKITHEVVGRNGKTIKSDRDVTVTALNTDWVTVNGAMDKILQIIPEREQVISDGRTLYVWQNGRIIRAPHPSEIEKAKGVKLENNRSTTP